MGIEILATLLSALASLTAGGILSSEAIRKALLHLFGRKEQVKPYGERLSELTANLVKASRQVDEVLLELSQVARDREKAVKTLESDLAALESREKELKQTIDDLQKTPLPVAEHFAKLIASGERRSAWRDYMLFGSGVVLSTVIAIGLKLAGLG
jgi:chromosome segregation ATPase